MADYDVKMSTINGEAAAEEEEEDEDEDESVVDLSTYLGPHDSASPVKTFAIEEHYRNTVDNPDRESTQVAPTLVRRIDSKELLPRPFKTTNQLVCTAYLSMLCCILPAAYAVKYAWKTKIKRNNGVFTSATKDAKRSCCFMQLALALGLVLWVVGLVMLALRFRTLS